MTSRSKFAIPWTEKYRPRNVSEISHQDEVLKILSNAIKIKNIPHFIFYGPPGTGKTSSALILASELFGRNKLSDRVLELNASDNRGIDVVRNQIKSWARHSISKDQINSETLDCLPQWKICILDEADNITSDAQSALRRIIENFSKNTRFIFICNYIHKIIDPIYSRCFPCRFKPISNDALREKISNIISSENISISDDRTMDALIEVSNGDLRRAITLLQSASYMYDSISEMDIYELSGYTPNTTISVFLGSCSKSFGELYSCIEDIIADGRDISQMMEQIIKMIINSKEINDIKKSKIALFLGDRYFALKQGSNEFLQLLCLSSKIHEILANDD